MLVLGLCELALKRQIKKALFIGLYLSNNGDYQLCLEFVSARQNKVEATCCTKNHLTFYANVDVLVNRILSTYCQTKRSRSV